MAKSLILYLINECLFNFLINELINNYFEILVHVFLIIYRIESFPIYFKAITIIIL